MSSLYSSTGGKFLIQFSTQISCKRNTAAAVGKICKFSAPADFITSCVAYIGLKALTFVHQCTAFHSNESITYIHMYIHTYIVGHVGII